jgi:PRTRC genetic system ThiF family protein
MKHYMHPELANKLIRIVLVGGGGSGSRMLENLICLHRAMLALGHPFGLSVTLIDCDQVSAANIGRQAFYACDIGSYKAMTLINRANMALGDTQWEAVVHKLTTKSGYLEGVDMVIGAVDNRSARLAILRLLEKGTGKGGSAYYLDLGNKASDGQVVLGEVNRSTRKTDPVHRLPHAGELFPELVMPSLDKLDDDVPSCSLAEALEKQSLYINTAVSLFASNILWQLFTKGEIEHHGAFVNLDCMTVMPIAVDPEMWARFGVKRNGKREKTLSK